MTKRVHIRSVFTKLLRYFTQSNLDNFAQQGEVLMFTELIELKTKVFIFIVRKRKELYIRVT